MEQFPYRKQLNAAITKAGHPGMFAKIAALEKMVAIEAVLSIVLDPHFDPHDPERLPWIVAPVKQNKLTLNMQVLDRLMTQLTMLEDVGAPEVVIESDKQSIEQKNTPRTARSINPC